MSKRALDVFEQNADGTWQCVRDAVIQGRYGLVSVKAGLRIARGAAFAGYDNFPAHLEAHSSSTGKDTTLI